MKTVCALAFVLLSALTVNAHGGGGGGGGGRGGRGGGPRNFCGPFEFFCEARGAGFCGCGQGRWNPCRGVVGTQVGGCPCTNQYVQCTGEVCLPQTCPSGQVWNKTQNACAQCADGLHVAANLQVCVCNQGTTFNRTSKTCVACPTGSTQGADSCSCPTTQSLDSTENACKDCPLGSTLQTRSQQCQCNASQFWNEGEWACQNCPGEWTPRQARRPYFRLGSKCTCTGTNRIFDRKTVTCYQCPTGTTTASRDECVCPNRYQVFNMESKQCECIKGWEADSAGTGCVRSAITTQPTTTPGQLNP